MALIKCPECGAEISDKAPQCIKCGYPLQAAATAAKAEAEVSRLFCRHCGGENRDTDTRCRKCGADLLKGIIKFCPVCGGQRKDILNNKCVHCGSTLVAAGQQYVCRSCGFIGGAKESKSSWDAFGILPVDLSDRIMYDKLRDKNKRCLKCTNADIVALDSPEGQRVLDDKRIPRAKFLHLREKK